MFDIEKNIRWDLFTEEERKIITEVYNTGEYQHFTCLPNVIIDTPAKELEIEKLVLDLMEIDSEDESEVREAMEKYLAEGGLIDTPEKEAEWEQRLEEERNKKREEIENRKNELKKKTLKKEIDSEESEEIEK